MIFTFLML